MYKPGETLKGLGRHSGEGQRYEVGLDVHCCAGAN